MFQRLVIEAVLQHYGATTYCVDFVDNHWTALWFGLYEWDKANYRYLLRNNTGCGEEGKYITQSDYMKKKPLPAGPTFETTILDNNKLQELQEHAKHTDVSYDELVRRNRAKKYEIDYRKWIHYEAIIHFVFYIITALRLQPAGTGPDCGNHTAGL